MKHLGNRELSSMTFYGIWVILRHNWSGFLDLEPNFGLKIFIHILTIQWLKIGKKWPIFDDILTSNNIKNDNERSLKFLNAVETYRKSGRTYSMPQKPIKSTIFGYFESLDRQNMFISRPKLGSKSQKPDQFWRNMPQNTIKGHTGSSFVTQILHNSQNKSFVVLYVLKNIDCKYETFDLKLVTAFL